MRARRKAAAARPDDLQIGGHAVGRGETQEILLKISEFYTSNPVNIPLTVIRGAEDGPTLFLTAAIHGDELNGVEIVRSVIQELDHTKIRGTLLCLPVVNRFGFNSHTRYLPDRRDLNRHFPGDPSGSSAERIAAILTHQVVGRATHGIDFHTAAIGHTNLPHLRADLSRKEVRALARSFGAELIVDAPGASRSLRAAAVASGVPTILYEGGETFRFQQREIRKGIVGVYNVLAGLGMLPIPPRRPRFRVIVKKTEWIRAEKGGILDLIARPGELVYEGEPLAVIENPFGREVSTLTALFTGLVIGTTTRPMVNPGDAICHLAKLDRTLPTIEGHLIVTASGRRRIPLDS